MTLVAARSLTSIVSRSWSQYIQLVERYPARMHSINTCLLMGTGDVIAQVTLENCRRPRDYDYRRSVRFFGVGLVLAGPGMHVWYSWLDRVIRGRSLNAAVAKMLADQILFLPIYLVVFVAVMGGLRGDTLTDVIAKLRRDMWPMLVTSYGIWPAVQLVNFRFVPLRHRILLINVVCLFWNTYIGWKAEEELKHSGQPTHSLDMAAVAL